MTALEGVALVTGGGRGIGEAIARRLAADGMRVAVTGRTAEHVERVAREIDGVGLVGDVSSEDDVARWLIGVERDLGPVDLLVCNAGISGFGAASAWEQAVDDWWRVLQVNLLGPYLCARGVLPGMIERGSGRIVNVSSNAAFLASADFLPPTSAYGASKAALNRLTELLAHEVKGTGVTVLAISPGMVATDMTDGVFPHATDDDWTPVERTADLVAFIATGALDGFSGRYVHARADDWQRLPEQLDTVLADDLMTQRLRRPAP